MKQLLEQLASFDSDDVDDWWEDDAVVADEIEVVDEESNSAEVSPPFMVPSPLLETTDTVVTTVAIQVAAGLLKEEQNETAEIAIRPVAKEEIDPVGSVTVRVKERAVASGEKSEAEEAEEKSTPNCVVDWPFRKQKLRSSKKGQVRKL
ncbi:unnamed protein product [Linum trigynum]|uniref:Uncharacterized protein n=1 Tax=Linum trigynum TaxID=586398 RepID=A0AAV2CCN1_9ROSI